MSLDRPSVYVLNSLLQVTDIIDNYYSLVWTEKYYAHGDFELNVPLTAYNQKVLKNRTFLMIDGSYSVMIIESIETNSGEKGDTMKLVGSSLESLLKSRVALKKFKIGDVEDYYSEWILEGTPSRIARDVFYGTCVLGQVSGADRIPFYVDSSFLASPTIPHSKEKVAVAVKPSSVYSVIENLAKTYDFGFRLIKHPRAQTLHFEVYTGFNRTALNQHGYAPVIFSYDLAAVDDITTYSVSRDETNVVYVVSRDFGTVIVKAAGIEHDIEPEGFDRMATTVYVDDLPEGISAGLAHDILKAKGEAVIMDSAPNVSFDGEVSHVLPYEYNSDYFLGDLVEVRGHYAVNYMKVIEHIYSVDNDGALKSYPTLNRYLSLTPGTWPTMMDRTWFGFEGDDDTTWSKMP
jgi:hypothetical protein